MIHLFPEPRAPHRRARRAAMIAGTAAVAAVSLILTGCSGGGSSTEKSKDSGPVTISFANWDAAESVSRQPLLDLVKTFEKAHPDIKVTVKPIPFSDMEQKILQQVQAGTAPDVVQTFGNYTADFYAAGALEPIDDLAGSSYLKQIPKTVLDVTKFDGKVVAAPWAVQPVGFWYNKKLMAQAGLDPKSPPKTIDELLSDLKTIKAKLPGVIPLGVDTTNRVFGLDVSWPWMQTFDGEPIKNGKAHATSSGTKDYLKFMRTLAQDKLTEVNKKIGYFRPLAAQNKVAFMWDQSILEPNIEATAKMDPKTFYATWSATTLPVGKSGKSFSVPQDHQLAILKSSKHKEAAWTFVKWMTRSNAALKNVVKLKGSLPPLSNPPADIKKMVEADPVFVAFRDKIVPTVVRPPWGAAYAKAYSPIMVGVQQMMTSNTSVDQVASQMQDQVKAALQ